MKVRWIMFLAILICGVLAVGDFVHAEQVVIKDIVIDAQDYFTKVTITSSQMLQIETFKNNSNQANYIVLDFLGRVYTNKPTIIAVEKGPVEKISLVRGASKGDEGLGQDYYELDFLAVNLKSNAEYDVKQNDTVIDLSIKDTQTQAAQESVPVATQEEESVKEPVEAEKAVELTPPIIVARVEDKGIPEIETQENNRRFRHRVESQPIAAAEEKKLERVEAVQENDRRNKRRVESQSIIATEEKKPEPIKEEVKGRKRSSRRAEEVSLAKAKENEIKEEKKKTRRERKSERPVSESKKAEVSLGKTQGEVAEKKEEVLLRREKQTPRSYFIDKIVEDTMQEKEITSQRIEDISSELRKMQEELSLSTGEKSKLENKIKEILAKLDELKGALDDEILRRQLLGEKVEDLIAIREEYIKAKRNFEELETEYSRVLKYVDDLNLEAQNIKNRLDTAQNEHKKMELDYSSISKEKVQIEEEYKSAIQSRDTVSLKIDKLTEELNLLRQRLDVIVDEKARLISQIKNLEEKNSFNVVELSRLKQLLQEKGLLVEDLYREYDRVKQKLDAAVSDKVKVEYSYQNAKSEYERIKSEIAAYLGQK
ncbi:MAG: hypothetical protein HY810_04265 [Candidatus Omnitrophica bacterium]|nr:hypothetical protein [Candidatus Omnitrophota bacterium]